MVRERFVTGNTTGSDIMHRHFLGNFIEVGDILGHIHPLSECSSGSCRFVLDPDILINIATSL